MCNLRFYSVVWLMLTAQILTKYTATVQYPMVSSSGCRRPCAVRVGLWECYTGWSSCSRCSSLQLGQLLVFVAQLTSHDTLASFHWSRANSFQTGGHCLLSYSWDCTPIPVSSAQPRCWHAISESTSVINHLIPSRLVTVGKRSFPSAGPNL